MKMSDEMKDWKMPLPEEALFHKHDVILYAYRGSHAHGTYVPSSDPDSIDDIDTMGVFFYPLSYYFGVPGKAYKRTIEIWEGEWDVVYYEISHFFRLLMKSNPNVMMMLFLRDQDYFVLEDFGREIIENKHLFCSKVAADTFIGYAESQLKKMTAFQACTGYLGAKRKRLIEKHGYDTKNASHCIRLLRMGCEFLKTGEMNVFRDDARELIDIKQGKWQLEKVQALAETLFADLNSLVQRSPLPDKPDVQGINDLLVSIMKRHFDM